MQARSAGIRGWPGGRRAAGWANAKPPMTRIPLALHPGRVSRSAGQRLSSRPAIDGRGWRLATNGDYKLQPAGVGPVRVRFSVPLRPAFSPAVNVYASVAAPQLWNVIVAVPTCWFVVGAGSLNTPPLLA